MNLFLEESWFLSATTHQVLVLASALAPNWPSNYLGGKEVSEKRSVQKTAMRDSRATLRESSSSLLRLALLAASHSSITRGSRNSTEEEQRVKVEEMNSLRIQFGALPIHAYSRDREL